MCIPSEFMKYNSQILAPHLLNCFNSMCKTGIVPSSWKTSYLTPIPKKGLLTDVTNYRGIAMQSVIPKLFDQLITNKVAAVIHKIISSDQHGFLKGRSTISNLMEKINFLHEQLLIAPQVDIVYFDYNKAFDQVDHHILAKKMCQLSIPYLVFKTLMSFVIGRKYVLKADSIVQKVVCRKAPIVGRCSSSSSHMISHCVYKTLALKTFSMQTTLNL